MEALEKLSGGGPAVGRVGLGCMGMSIMYESPTRTEGESVRVIRRALELGMTLIDTADVYGPFVNEELVGRALHGVRQTAVLATKVGLRMDDPDSPPRRDGRPEYVRRSIDGSLRRLDTDHIDLWQLHRPDPAVPVEETWTAMADIARQGKACALGLSEVSVDEITRCARIHPVASVQSELSLWTRDALDEVVPYCLEHGIAFLAFCPLGRGFLTGSITSNADLDPADARHALPRFDSAAIDANQAIVGAVADVARSAGASLAQVALAWVSSRGDGVVPIAGTTSLRHLCENAAAAELRLSAEQLARLDAVPAPVGARY